MAQLLTFEDLEGGDQFMILPNGSPFCKINKNILYTDDNGAEKYVNAINLVNGSLVYIISNSEVRKV